MNSLFYQLCFLSNSVGVTSTSRAESSPASQRTTATVPNVNITATHSSQPHASSYATAITTVQSLPLTASSFSLSSISRSRNYSTVTAVEISTVVEVDVSTSSSLAMTHITKETSIKPSINSAQQSRVSSTAANSFKSKFQLKKRCRYEEQEVKMLPSLLAYMAR